MGEVISSGSRVVLNGQIIEDPDVQQSGCLYINSGGSANNAKVHGGGQYFVLSNGKDTSASILSGGTMQVNQGRSLDLQIFSGGIVTGGGAYMSNVLVKSGGSLTLSGLVNKAGQIVTQGNVQNTTINEGGVMKLDKFAAANMTKINGGSLLLFNGAEAYDVRLSSGYAHVSCGSAYDVTMYGGSMLISGNGVLDQGIVDGLTLSAGIVWVEAGGVVRNATIDNNIRVYQYGSLEDATVRMTGAVYLDGGEQHGGIVHGSETIREDGAAYNVTFNGTVYMAGSAIGCNLAGGDIMVSEGGFFSGTANMNTTTGHATFTVNSGGTAIVTKASGTRVNAYLSGGVMDLNAGGITFVQLLDNGGGTFNLRAGASANEASLAVGVMNVEGVLRDATVSSGASVMISSGGVITGKFYIKDGAVVSAAAGGIVDFDISGSTVGQGAILSSLSLVTGTPDYSLTVGESQAVGTYMLAGGAAGFNKTLTVKNSAGTELGTLTVDGDVVGYSGKVFGLKLNDGVLSVTAANGSAGNIFMGTVTSGTKEITSGMTALGATVNEEGLLSILSKGNASNTVVNFGGEMVVSTGGRLRGVTIESGGTVSVLEDVMAQNVVVNGGIFSLEQYSWAYQSKGSTVLSNTVVKNGGQVIVHESAYLVGALVSDGGRVDVLSDGEFGYGKVNGGEIYAFNGAHVSRVDLEDGGILNVESGGSVQHIYVSAGGVLTGVLREASELTFYGGTLDLDISNASPESEFLIDEQSYSAINMHSGESIYYLCTLTVDDSQAHGVYQLIEWAYDFDQTITVVNTSGTELGTLSLGSSVAIGNDLYTLSKTDGTYSLLVTIEDNPTPPKPGSYIAKSDIDGNGISDVMFVWTGEHGDGNYQHGYWMNGTNEWQSANSNHPAEWDNLGCYDMAGDGKADSVLVGNVEVGGVKGAYIGYYADANDLPDGSTWVNIGYLTNENGILWKNKVGNLTGNASGANSIVWYAPELYALGAWTDGTENWVTLNNNFGGDAWTLVGCGDFTGDGKDQVVMALNGGAQYYVVGIDGVSYELTKSTNEWEIRAIGDFKGDGKDDIVAFHADTGLVFMWDDGDSSRWSNLGQLDANDWFVVGAGDYDGDAQDDLLVRQKSTGMLGYYSSGDMTQWNTLGYGVDMNWTVIA